MTSDLDHYRPTDQAPGIVGLGVRYRELGRLRMGEKTPVLERGQPKVKDGKPVMRPAKLETWRFTSTDWRLIKRAAELYGGKPETWAEAPGWNPEKKTGVRQFQVTTEKNDLPVMLPPEVALSQAMEAWKATECLRRCDGTWDQISGAECLCSDEESPLCKPTTRLSVLLTDMPGLGVWRLETHGWYAARELVPMVRLAASFGAGQRFRLRIDPRQRQTKENGKTVTYLFGVPVLDTDLTPGQLLAQTSRAGDVLAPPDVPALGSNPTTTAPEEGDAIPPDDDGAGPAVDIGGEPSEGTAVASSAGPTPSTSKTRPGDVIRWLQTHKLLPSRALEHLKAEHPDDFGDLRNVTDLGALGGHQADLAIAHLTAAYDKAATPAPDEPPGWER